jgi:hypothetical protein
LESLEDRSVPNAGPGGGFGFGLASDPATHFLILTQPSAQAGLPAEIDVIALDAANQRTSAYTGTIQLSSTDSSTTSGGSALPITYTFQARDRGAHEFVLTPGAAGTETLSATDTSNSSLTGSADLTVNAAPVATHFLIVPVSRDQSSSATVGSATSLAVVALDASNHIVPNYTGTVQLSSTDSSTTSGGSALPITYTFQSSDHGVHVFSVTPGAVGTETLTATDTSDSSLTGSVDLQVNAAPVATHFLVSVQPSSQAGQPSRVIVAALDASNRIVTNYVGTVQLSSSDSAATLGGAALPTTSAFQASDNGVHSFSVTFNSTGSQTITATDTANSSLTGSATTSVGTTASLTGHHSGGGPLFGLNDHVFAHFHG